MKSKSQPAPKTEPTDELPRYRLREKAAFVEVTVVRASGERVPLSDVMLDPEEQPLVEKLSGPFGGRGDPERVPLIIEYDGIPGPHMEPLNDAANAMYAEHEVSKLRNPIDALTIVGGEGA